MPRFRIGVPEVHYSYRTVEAESVEEAIDSAMDAECEELEYSHTLDDENCIVVNLDTQCRDLVPSS